MPLPATRTCVMIAALMVAPCAVSAPPPSSPMLASLSNTGQKPVTQTISNRNNRPQVVELDRASVTVNKASALALVSRIAEAARAAKAAEKARAAESSPQEKVSVAETNATDAPASAWWQSVDKLPQTPDGLAPGEVWVYIDADEQSLTLMRGDKRLKYIDHVAFGMGGSKAVRLRGSQLTPEGDFRIDRINGQSQYRRFFRIDYPNPTVAREALKQGVISQSTHDYITRYYAEHGTAPMDTPLGGQLGLHGLGNKDPFMHERINKWTDGCAAVTNTEIDALKPWLAVGTRVIIE